jgi:hypothetical protein
MANYTPHQYMRIGGDYGPEEWSIGLRLQVTVTNLDLVWEALASILQGKVPDPTNDNEAVSAYIAVKSENLVKSWFGAMATRILPGVTCSYITVNHIGRDGKYSSASSIRNDFSSPVTGSATGTHDWLGPDAAMVVSLLTAAKRGYASKGRIYLPVNANILERASGSWGNYQANDRTMVLDATKTLFDGINDLGGLLDGVEPQVCVFSPGTGKYQNPSTPGTYRPVKAIRVGAQPDTQRRRLNKQPDLWSGDTTFAREIDA